MAAHSSILAWEIPWAEESGGLQSMGLQRIGHDLVTKQQQHNLDKVCISEPLSKIPIQVNLLRRLFRFFVKKYRFTLCCFQQSFK